MIWRLGSILAVDGLQDEIDPPMIEFGSRKARNKLVHRAIRLAVLGPAHSTGQPGPQVLDLVWAVNDIGSIGQGTRRRNVQGQW